MSITNQINVAIQVLPKCCSKDTYAIVDKAIEKIQASGLQYLVCPFETVIQGPYDEVMQLVKEVQQTCFEHGAEHLITNLKIQISNATDVSIDDKIGKYKLNQR